MKDQHTSVSEGVARQIGRMAEDATRSFNGSTKQAEFAKGNPQFIIRFQKLLKNLATEQEVRLWINRLLTRTIALGTGLKSAKEFIGAIENAGMQVREDAKHYFALSYYFRDILPDVNLLELIEVKVEDLGFSYVSLKEIYERAGNVGLCPCPPEAGPQFRLQYRDQPEGECLRMIVDDSGDFSTSSHQILVGCDETGQYISSSGEPPGGQWPSSTVFVFCRKKKAPQS